MTFAANILGITVGDAVRPFTCLRVWDLEGGDRAIADGLPNVLHKPATRAHVFAVLQTSLGIC